MSKKTTVSPGKPGKKAPFKVKPLKAAQVALVVLDELSREYPDVCNFSEASSLVRENELYLALLSVMDLQSNLDSAAVSARSVWAHAQAVSVLKKCVDPSYDPWPETRAVWFATEARCRRLNQKFNALANRRKRPGSKPLPNQRLLYRFYEAIHHVLGSEVPVEDVLLHAHYGPGSTVGVRGRDVNFVRKVESNECVSACVDLAARALVYDKAVWAHLGMDPTFSHVESAQEGFIRVAREQLLQHVVSHDRLMFIFKSMTSLRSIGAQPTCSGMVQLGVHSVVTELLRTRAGIDLSDQTWNQRLALEGSRSWDSPNPWCTLDKSNASNLIANELVRLFFPPAWSKFLQRTRTPGYVAPPQLGGGSYTYEMYAGMGNGTTFVVETLIFWAATYATQDLPIEEYVRRREFAVYGDDVVLRRNHAEAYMAFAHYLGFRFNAKKTFIEGPFRESCGADFFKGVPVRPATLECESGSVSLPTLISFHNNLLDNKVFPLRGACRKLRYLAKTHLYPVLPTDPAGDLGFRPDDRAHYDIVRDASGTPRLSEAWQRPRTFVLEVRPQYGDLGELDHWTQVAVALLRARQDSAHSDDWSLPVRGLVNYRVVAEKDLDKSDLVLMLRNQLSRLCYRKAQPWWSDSRGS